MGMMINRRRVCGGKKGLLPSGYTQLEYIENTSTAYINTGVISNIQNSYEIKFQLTYLNAPQRIFGNWYSKNTSQLSLVSTLDRISFSMGDTSMCNITSDTQWHILKYNGLTKTGNIDGYSTGNVATKTAAQENYLFASKNPNGIEGHAKCRVFSCIIHYQLTLVRNFIPCKNPQNIVGMYDTVNGVFYSSPNGTAFIAGPEV